MLTRRHAAASPLPEPLPLPDDPRAAAATEFGDGLPPVLRGGAGACTPDDALPRFLDVAVSGSTSAMLSAWSALSERWSSRGLSWGDPLPRLNRGDNTADNDVSRTAGTRASSCCVGCCAQLEFQMGVAATLRGPWTDCGASPGHPDRTSTAPDVTVEPAIFARALSRDAGASTGRRAVGGGTGAATDVDVIERQELAGPEVGFGG